jgi:hypothetical protein
MELYSNMLQTYWDAAQFNYYTPYASFNVSQPLQRIMNESANTIDVGATLRIPRNATQLPARLVSVS